jgi:pimeloyl-ACP methyl ester carboxylesterase
VGWSYGAAVALPGATRHQGRIVGVAMVDGDYQRDYLATSVTATVKPAASRFARCSAAAGWRCRWLA